jgi:ABC-type antimicrobial peptide transport system permease subunit
VSLARIKAVAQLIRQRTHLAVDITAGSSPTHMDISLPPGEYGRPPLLLEEDWVKKGVAVVILKALDRKSLALFVLVLAVSALFLMNGALASARSRRRELGTLLCLGWPHSRIFLAVLGELALIGIAAGVLGTALAMGLIRLLSLRMPLARAILVTPIAVLLAVVAGLLPAWRAARSVPLDALMPPVTRGATTRSVKRVLGVAVVNLRRLPGRTLLGASGLFVAVGALTVLLAVNVAFRGVLVGTLLGGVVSLQVRAVDFATVGLAIALGGLSVTDVLVLNLRERAPEFVTLRASGWSGRRLAELVALEGLGLGLLGSVSGAATGVAIARAIGRTSYGAVLTSGAIAAAGGLLAALIASVVPSLLVARLASPAVLAEE